MINNMKKMLESQQKMNEAVKAITNYFEDSPYETDLELMLDATTQIVGLMELAKQQMIKTSGMDELVFKTDDITIFLRVVNEHLKMLRPFAMMTEGKEVEL
jgi:hypothetical protein